MNIGPKYIGIIFTIKMEQKIRITDLESITFQLIKYSKICKRESKDKR